MRKTRDSWKCCDTNLTIHIIRIVMWTIVASTLLTSQNYLRNTIDDDALFHFLYLFLVSTFVIHIKIAIVTQYFRIMSRTIFFFFVKQNFIWLCQPTWSGCLNGNIILNIKIYATNSKEKKNVNFFTYHNPSGNCNKRRNEWILEIYDAFSLIIFDLFLFSFLQILEFSWFFFFVFGFTVETK